MYLLSKIDLIQTAIFSEPFIKVTSTPQNSLIICFAILTRIHFTLTSDNTVVSRLKYSILKLFFNLILLQCYKDKNESFCNLPISKHFQSV